jgi:hypothetical protein
LNTCNTGCINRCKISYICNQTTLYERVSTWKKKFLGVPSTASSKPVITCGRAISGLRRSEINVLERRRHSPVLFISKVSAERRPLVLILHKSLDNLRTKTEASAYY